MQVTKRRRKTRLASMKPTFKNSKGQQIAFTQNFTHITTQLVARQNPIRRDSKRVGLRREPHSYTKDDWPQIVAPLQVFLNFFSILSQELHVIFSLSFFTPPLSLLDQRAQVLYAPYLSQQECVQAYMSSSLESKVLTMNYDEVQAQGHLFIQHKCTLLQNHFCFQPKSDSCKKELVKLAF